MTHLPEIYAVCSNGTCNHVWTEPPTRPCPSCGTEMIPTFVDTQDGSSGVDPDYLSLLKDLSSQVDATNESFVEQMKELQKLRGQMVHQRMEEHGVMEGDECPNCQRGRLVEVIGQERDAEKATLTCDMPHTICDYQVKVERVPPMAEWPHPDNNDRKKGRHG